MPDLLPGRMGGKAQVVGVVALGALLYLTCLGLRDLTYPDEPDVAEPARAMLVSGDWTTPRHGEVAWIDYPPLVFWAQALAAQALGQISGYAHRLPAALAGIGLALAVLLFGRSRLAPRSGVLAAIVLLTMPQFAWQAVNAHPDMLFAALQGVGLLLYVAAERWNPRHAWPARVAAFGCLGAAVLAKGPLGLLLPGLVLTLWHASLGQWRRILLLAPLSLVSVAVVLPWYLALAQTQGWEFVNREVVAQNFGRFAAGSGRGHERPVHYYLHRLVPDLGGWLLLPLPFLAHLKGLLWTDPVRRFLVIWGGATLLVLTLAATKRGVYLLPAYAALALLVGDLLARVLDAARDPASVAARRMRHIAAVGMWVAAALVLMGGVAPFLLETIASLAALGDGPERAATLALAPALGVGAAVCVGVWALLRSGARTGRAAHTVAGLAFFHGGLFLVTVLLAVPQFDRVLSYRPVGAWLQQHVARHEPVGFLAPGFEVRRRAAFLYYSERPLRYLTTIGDLRAFLAETPTRVAVVGHMLTAPLEADPALAALVRARFEVSGKTWTVVGPAAGGTAPERPAGG